MLNSTQPRGGVTDVARSKKEVQKLAEVDLNYSTNSRKRKFLIRFFSAATSLYRYPPL